MTSARPLRSSSPSHGCTGAECPICGVFAPTEVRPPNDPDLYTVQIAQDQFTGVTASILPSYEQGPTWQDSRGLPVQGPVTKVLPSTCLIIPQGPAGLPWTLLCHQRQDNGYWGFPGGGCEPGESLMACALREGYEETGLRLTIDRLVHVDSDPAAGAICVYGNSLVQYCCCTFLMRIASGVPRMSAESLALGWYPSHALPEPFLPTHRWRLAQAVEVLRGLPVEVR